MFASLTALARSIPPDHEEWIPHLYQTRAVEFLLERGSAALFLDPGLGKTSITLEAFCQLQDAGRAEKMLVIAPLRVCQLVWRQEATQWTQFNHLRFTLLHGPKKDDLLYHESDVYLINPEGCSWLADQFWGKPFPFDTVVYDELTRFKNAQAVRHKAMLPLMKRVQRRWGLTGTPIPNGYMDLFGQMKILDDGAALGTYITHYRNKYFSKDYTGYGYDLVRGGSKAIEAAIAPYTLRMSAEDYLELPKLVEDVRHVVMPPKARKTYEEMKKDLITELKAETVEAGNAAAAYSKLKQMANGAVYAGDGFLEPRKTIHLHDAKIEAMLELIEELSGTPLLLGYEFNHDLARIRKAMGYDVPYIGSGVSGAAVEKIERDWNNGDIPVLLAHPASAAHGLNLQKGNACHVAWFSVTWDYELYDQFMRRVLRQGNTSLRVFNHIFIVDDTIDNLTQIAILDKGLTQNAFFDAMTTEIFHDGKRAAPPEESKEDLDMSIRKVREVRKLGRQARATEEPVEEVEEEIEEEAPKRQSRRAASRRKLRGETEETEEVETGEEQDEPVSARAKRAFSKKVQARIDPEEEEAEEEPAPKPRRSRKPTVVEEADDDTVEDLLPEAPEAAAIAGEIPARYVPSDQDLRAQCVQIATGAAGPGSCSAENIVEDADILFNYIQNGAVADAA